MASPRSMCVHTSPSGVCTGSLFTVSGGRARAASSVPEGRAQAAPYASQLKPVQQMCTVLAHHRVCYMVHAAGLWPVYDAIDRMGSGALPGCHLSAACS